MAKDPRFNFYPDNWTGGTKRMTFEQKGAYLELLMLNFYCFSDGLKGFTEREALHSLAHAAAYAALWDFLKPKFKQDGDLFYSERMQKEFLKAKIHSEKQSERAKKRVYKTSAHPTEEPTASAAADACNGTGSGIGTESKNKKESEKFDSRETHDFTKPDIRGDELIFPLDTPKVRELWASWKKYRWEKYDTRYGMMGEQADLKRMQRMNFQQIESTILTAIANNWKNLYPEKELKRHDTGTNKKQQQSQQTGDYLTDYYKEKLGKNPANSNS